MIRRVAALLASAALGAGCQGAGPPTARVPEPAESDGWFEVRQRPEGTPCAPLPATPGGRRTVEVRLFRGVGVTDAEVRVRTSLLQGFFEPYGLEFRAVGPPIELPWDAAIVGREAEVARAGGGGELDLDAVADVVFAPLRAFMRQYAVPARDAIHIVVLRHVVHPGSLAARRLPRLAGLGFSPALVGAAHEAEPVRAAYAALGVGRAFTPTVFVATKEAAALPREQADAVIAHEVGHALGLPHRDRPGNLMAREPQACVPVLDAEQSAYLVGAQAVALGAPTGVETLP